MGGRQKNDFHSSRRRFAGLAGLATLLGSSRVDASSYLGSKPASLVAEGISKGADPRSHSAAMVVDVMDFGAKGDAITDDAPAINAAIHAVRERHQRAGAFDLGCRIIFPTALYAVNSSIDLTGLQRINTVIDGGGAAILGRCTGQPVIDALNTRWLTVRDLTVLGDPVSVPDIGIQIGVVSNKIVADDHRFEDVKVLGHFARACLYNRAAETTGFDHLLLWNHHPNSYCLIQDGVNHFGVTSRFIEVSLPLDRSLSFNENEFINCDFRHGGGGTPVWLGDTARHAFIRCYSATEGVESFVVFCGQNGHLMLDVDCHIETDKARYAFLFSGMSNHLRLRGFRYRDHHCFASEAIFRCDEHVTHVELQNAHLEVAGFANQLCNVFSRPDRWSGTGGFYSADAGHWNGTDSFTGVVTVGSDVNFSGMPPLAMRIAERPLGANPPPQNKGALFYDHAGNKLILWTGSAWVDALGNPS